MRNFVCLASKRASSPHFLLCSLFIYLVSSRVDLCSVLLSSWQKWAFVTLTNQQRHSTWEENEFIKEKFNVLFISLSSRSHAISIVVESLSTFGKYRLHHFQLIITTWKQSASKIANILLILMSKADVVIDDVVDNSQFLLFTRSRWLFEVETMMSKEYTFANFQEIPNLLISYSCAFLWHLRVFNKFADSYIREGGRIFLGKSLKRSRFFSNVSWVLP